MPAETISYCIKSIHEYPGVKTDRFFDWFQFVAPDFLVNILSPELISEESLSQIIFLYKGKNKSSSSSDEDSSYIWLPIAGEKILQSITDSKNNNSAASSMVEVNMVIQTMENLPELIKGILYKIRSHLHVSEVEEAASLIRKLYSPDIDKDDFALLMSDPEIRSRLEIIRHQICPELNAVSFKERLLASIHITRTINKNTDENKPFITLIQNLEDEFKEEASLTTIIQAVKKIKNYPGNDKNRFLPLILDIREHFLNQGVTPPKEIDPSLWLKTAMDIGVYTGEIKPKTQFLWRHSITQGPNKETQLTILKQLQLRYKQLSTIQDYFKILNPNDPTKAADEYRNLTSRSLIDWIYRAVQNSIEE